MMKTQKMINLDRQSLEAAKKIPNFSKWVRHQLWMKENNHDSSRTLQRYQALVKAVVNLEDVELRQSIMDQYKTNLDQKTLEEFE